MSTYFARQLGLTRLEESQSIPRLRTYHSLHLQSTETTEKKYNFIQTSKQKRTLVCSYLKLFITLTLIHSLPMLLRLINCSHSNTSHSFSNNRVELCKLRFYRSGSGWIYPKKLGSVFIYLSILFTL